LVVKAIDFKVGHPYVRGRYSTFLPSLRRWFQSSKVVSKVVAHYFSFWPTGRAIVDHIDNSHSVSMIATMYAIQQAESAYFFHNQHLRHKERLCQEPALKQAGLTRPSRNK
jgi:hypothetical protein